MIHDLLANDAATTEFPRPSVAPVGRRGQGYAAGSLEQTSAGYRYGGTARSGGPTWYPPVKRTLDVVAALGLLVCLLPLFLVVALLIKLDSPGPVFYRQQRVGRGARRFRIYKFRSMCDGAERRLDELLPMNEADGLLFKLRCDPRVTRVGKTLRRFSIDELPQLFNVILGDMSLVGPRPPLQREVDRYDLRQCRRLDVTPGLTGLWQVSGRSDLPFDEGMALDLQYVSQCSLLLDLAIIARTLPAIFHCRGAY